MIKIRPYKAKPSENDIPVNGKLALTPAKMMKMAERGIPISSQTLNNEYFDGDIKVSWEVPMDRQRGVDVNDMWNHNEDVRKRLKSATKDAVKANRKERRQNDSNMVN